MELNQEHKTPVKIQLTEIKCLNNEDSLTIIHAYGRLNVTECKQIAKDNNLIFITKELISDTHNILTSELMKLV